jgi:hypothetical protein
MADTYRFHVKGHLDDRWSDWLGGVTGYSPPGVGEKSLAKVRRL